MVGHRRVGRLSRLDRRSHQDHAGQTQCTEHESGDEQPAGEYTIALGSGRTVDANSPFTFAQVALYRAVKALRLEEVEVEVTGIPSR
ncbi:hypothetical protein [Plantactinospora veratri]